MLTQVSKDPEGFNLLKKQCHTEICIATLKTERVTNVPLAGIRDCEFHSVQSHPLIPTVIIFFSRKMTMPQKLLLGILAKASSSTSDTAMERVCHLLSAEAT